MTESVAIGSTATATGPNAVAIGRNATSPGWGVTTASAARALEKVLGRGPLGSRMRTVGSRTAVTPSPDPAAHRGAAVRPQAPLTYEGLKRECSRILKGARAEVRSEIGGRRLASRGLPQGEAL